MTTTDNKGRFLFLDIFKLIAAFLVVCIHLEEWMLPPQVLSNIARVAVPFFFIASGYFTRVNISSGGGYLKYIKKTLCYILFAFAVYIVYDVIVLLISTDSMSALGQYFQGYLELTILDIFFFNKVGCSGYHLWFLVALFVVKTIHYICVKFNMTKVYLYLSIILLVIAQMLCNYGSLFGIYPSYAVIRNAWLIGLPFFMIGVMMQKVKVNRKYIFLIVGISFALLQLVEGYAIECFFPTAKHEFYISSIVSSICLFIFCVNTRQVQYKKYSVLSFANLPFNIYVFHIMVSRITRIDNSVLVYLITFTICYLSAVVKRLIKVKKQTLN